MHLHFLLEMSAVKGLIIGVWLVAGVVTFLKHARLKSDNGFLLAS